MAKRGQAGPQAPYIHPGVNPEALRRAGQQGGRVGGLPKTTALVAGGRGPSVPRLDGPTQEGVTMAQQAEAARRASAGPVVPGGIVEAPQPTSPAGMGLLPVDLLPEQAMQDPSFQQGHGSMYAAAQPHLAKKYGVIRNGKFIPPQKFSEQRPGLRAETLRDLETLNELAKQQQANQPVGALHGSEAEAEASLKGSAAEAAARAGNVPGDDSSEPLTEKEKEELGKAIDKMDEFDLDSFRQAMMRDIINNPDQKELIEGRLNPLNIDEIILRNRVKQTVPIVPGKFEITFQSMTGEEDLELKRMIMEESKSVEISDRYLLDKYSFMSVAIGLHSINGKPLGDVSDDEGNFSEEKFWRKFNRVLKLPLHMLASAGVNLFWFEARVRKLFVAEKVGNG